MFQGDASVYRGQHFATSVLYLLVKKITNNTYIFITRQVADLSLFQGIKIQYIKL